MNWTWIAGGAGAIVLVVAALYFFGITAVVKLVGDVVRFLAQSASAGLRWLGKPGSKLKAVCAVLAFASLTFGIQSMQRGQVIVTQRGAYTQLERDKAAAEREAAARAAALNLQLTTYAERIEQFRELARQQSALLDAARLESKAAVAEAAAARAAAARSAAAFQREFNAKPPECTAALAIMEKACPSLSEY